MEKQDISRRVNPETINSYRWSTHVEVNVVDGVNDTVHRPAISESLQESLELLKRLLE